MQHKRRVKEAFSKAATTYNHAAIIQKMVGIELAQRVKPSIKNHHSVVEIGCGTGSFAKQVLSECTPSSYTVTDVSSAMTRQALDRLNKLDNVQGFAIDGERFALAQRTDHILSNMAFQWFEDLPSTLSNLMRHTDHLAFSILLDQSFCEWEEACKQNGMKPLLLPLHTTESLQAALPKGCSAEIAQQSLKASYPNWLSFWRGIRKIGAQTPQENSSYPILNRSFLASHPVQVSFNVAYCEIVRTK